MLPGTTKSPARKRKDGRGEESDDNSEFVIVTDQFDDEDGVLTSPLPVTIETKTALSELAPPQLFTETKTPRTPPAFDEVWRQCLDLVGPPETPSSASEVKSDDESGSEMDTVAEDEETTLVTEITGHQLAWQNSNMAQPFVLFKIDSKLLFCGQLIKKRTALHRYSDFEQLRSAVKTEYERRHSHLVTNLPSLPGKRFLVDHTSVDFICERRGALNEYLCKLSQMPYVQKSVALLQFLRLDC